MKQPDICLDVTWLQGLSAALVGRPWLVGAVRIASDRVEQPCPVFCPKGRRQGTGQLEEGWKKTKKHEIAAIAAKRILGYHIITWVHTFRAAARGWLKADAVTP